MELEEERRRRDVAKLQWGKVGKDRWKEKRNERLRELWLWEGEGGGVGGRGVFGVMDGLMMEIDAAGWRMDDCR